MCGWSGSLLQMVALIELSGSCNWGAKKLTWNDLQELLQGEKTH